MAGKIDKVTKVLVTGGAGFVGSWIVKALVKAHPEYKIAVLDAKPSDTFVSPADGVEYIETDIRKAFEISSAVEWFGPDVIVHTAAWVPTGSRRYARRPQDVHNIQRINVEGTQNMLDAAKEFGVQAFVLTSSCTIITDDLGHDYRNYDENTPVPPRTTIYGESKAAAEKLVIQANSNEMVTCALRLSVTFGPGDYQLVPAIHAQIAARQTPYMLGICDNLYDFTYVENIAHAHVLAIENLLGTKTAAGHAINISNHQPVTFRDFSLATWAAFAHHPPFIISIPDSVAWVAALAADCLGWIMGTPFALSRGSLKDALGTRYASHAKAKKILGYEPVVDLWDGIRLAAKVWTNIDHAILQALILV